MSKSSTAPLSSFLALCCLFFLASANRSIPIIRSFDRFTMDETQIPDIHVWAGEPFQIELKEIPRREVPYGTTSWFREVDWLADTWVPLGESDTLDSTDNCRNQQGARFPHLHLAGCGANLLSFSEAGLYTHSARFLGRYMSSQSHLYFYARVIVHQPQTVLVPTWYGSHFVPRWVDLHYPQILRFQCHSLGGHSLLPVYSEIRRSHQGEIQGTGTNRTTVSGTGTALFGLTLRDSGTSTPFEARCCVRGADVPGLGGQNRCGHWVRIELRSTIYARRKWCPRFTGTYALTKDRLNNTDAAVVSKCRHRQVKIDGRMKSRVCEGQSVVYLPHYTAQAWYKQTLASPVLDNMRAFKGDNGSVAGPHALTIHQMAHRYAGWYLYNTSAVAAGEILVDLAMEAKLRVFIALERLDHKSFTVKCVTNLDHDKHAAGLRVWWDMKTSVQSVTKVDERTLRIEDACHNTRHVLNFLFHLRCHASTHLQTGVSEIFAGNGWRTFWEPGDMPAHHWGRWLFQQ